jgi:hypothetical protein
VSGAFGRGNEISIGRHAEPCDSSFAIGVVMKVVLFERKKLRSMRLQILEDAIVMHGPLNLTDIYLFGTRKSYRYGNLTRSGLLINYHASVQLSLQVAVEDSNCSITRRPDPTCLAC